ncbi:MAG: ATP-dependent Clp protease proteolytic subunit [Nitrosopumilus sp.]
MSYRGITDKLKSDEYEYSSDYLTRERRFLFFRGLIMSYGGGFEGRSDPFSTTVVADDLMTLAMEAPELPITLFVDGPGGEVANGFTLYDTIRMSPAPIVTIGLNCASMASIILVSGHQRYMYPHGKVMLHLPSTVFQGDSDEMDIRNKEIARVKDELVGIYIEHGATAGLGKHTSEKKIRNKITRDINKEKWFDAQEAIEYGLIDGLATKEMIYG